ncbi:MAG: hypothetical protein FJ194_14235, partial [Gammaproteobacteria bacterium]|nr:hypothetical protein [Gammaproteobacteria bacterium]
MDFTRGRKNMAVMLPIHPMELAMSEDCDHKATAFLDRHREAVLSFARKPLRELLGNPEVQSLIQRIEADDRCAVLMP